MALELEGHYTWSLGTRRMISYPFTQARARRVLLRLKVRSLEFIRDSCQKDIKSLSCTK